MSEIPKAFEGGIVLEYTCWKHMRGEIRLVRLRGMDDKNYADYVAKSGQACWLCSFERRHYCSQINWRGTAEADTLSDAVLNSVLRDREAPCAARITRVIS